MFISFNFKYSSVTIKVEPYWNVNFDISKLSNIANLIKVEPYWNVNFLLF